MNRSTLRRLCIRFVAIGLLFGNLTITLSAHDLYPSRLSEEVVQLKNCWGEVSICHPRRDINREVLAKPILQTESASSKQALSQTVDWSPTWQLLPELRNCYSSIALRIDALYSCSQVLDRSCQSARRALIELAQILQDRSLSMRLLVTQQNSLDESTDKHVWRVAQPDWGVPPTPKRSQSSVGFARSDSRLSGLELNLALDQVAQSWDSPAESASVSSNSRRLETCLGPICQFDANTGPQTKLDANPSLDSILFACNRARELVIRRINDLSWLAKLVERRSDFTRPLAVVAQAKLSEISESIWTRAHTVSPAFEYPFLIKYETDDGHTFVFAPEHARRWGLLTAVRQGPEEKTLSRNSESVPATGHVVDHRLLESLKAAMMAIADVATRRFADTASTLDEWYGGECFSRIASEFSSRLLW